MAILFIPEPVEVIRSGKNKKWNGKKVLYNWPTMKPSFWASTDLT